MTWVQIAGLAAFVGILTGLRDLLAAWRRRNRTLTEDERAQMREPIEVHRIIADNTRDAVSLQSALLLDLRGDVQRLRNESAEKDAKIADLQNQLSVSRREVNRLYAEVGRLTTRVNDVEVQSHDE